MSEFPAIEFNRPFLTGRETVAINQALQEGHLHGDGRFSHLCQQWFVEHLGAQRAFMTASCTLGLDMAALVSGIGPGDEVLVPDFTFVSTAQCVALRGAVPVLCDIRPDTLNLDEARLEEALTDKTRAVMPVHYGGISAEMDTICRFAEKHGLLVIEDAAQAIGCTYHGKPVGSMGDMSVFSFHSTKNVHCGEGGMLVVNNAQYSDRCAIAWEKGTDRSRFLEGNVEKYQWQELGSSFLASELAASMLQVQLDAAESINQRRLAIWQTYRAALQPYADSGNIGLPEIPGNVTHNGHLFYVLFPDSDTRTAMISHLASRDIQAVFHYTPLHESNGGRKYGRQGMTLENAATLPHRLLRLPLYPDLTGDEQQRVIDAVCEFLEAH